MNTTRSTLWRRNIPGTTAVLFAICAIIYGMGPGAARADNLSATFTICGEGRRINCVVDGDTFWFQRQKIRLADIDAPEISPPRCAYERERGEAAKHRLLALLNAGPFSLSSTGHDKDRYGRKLRIVTRDDRSIGSALVSEGLARAWTGARRSWCD